MNSIVRSTLVNGAFALATHAVAADITSKQLGDNTGEDWEPAILADGGYVYALWPHYLATSLHDSSGATCMPFSPPRAAVRTTPPPLICTSSPRVTAAPPGAALPQYVLRMVGNQQHRQGPDDLLRAALE